MMSFPNPLIEQRADPHITLHSDGYYYFTASVPKYDLIELRRSRTIAGLRDAVPKVIWKKHAAGDMSWHIWAPELHWIDGSWYIYFAAGKAEAIWEIRPWILGNSSPDPMQGTWKELGRMQTGHDSFSLDGTTFAHRNKRYWVWAQKDWDGANTSDLFIAEMTSPTSLKLPGVRLSTPDQPWERIGHLVNEGPAVLKRNGKIFISYSASATDHNYCIGLLSADENADLLDPKSWKKSPGPLLCTSATLKHFGPGHNSFVVAEDGKTDLLVYHARPYRDCVPDPLNDPNRHTRVLPVQWDESGYPILRYPE